MRSPRDHLLYLVRSTPLSQAAATVGVTEATARRWVAEDEAARKLADAERQARRFDQGPQPKMVSDPPKGRYRERRSGPN